MGEHWNDKLGNYRALDRNTDELFETFVNANEALERKACRGGQHQFGIDYLAKRADREAGLIRVLVVAQTDRSYGLGIAADEISSSRSCLAVMKCEIDVGDPDDEWRWLAEDVIASDTMFEGS